MVTLRKFEQGWNPDTRFGLRKGQYVSVLPVRPEKLAARIPPVKLKIPGKVTFEIRIPNFCYIQVIVFDLSYLPVAAVGT